jgi:hypothetical protein
MVVGSQPQHSAMWKKEGQIDGMEERKIARQ